MYFRLSFYWLVYHSLPLLLLTVAVVYVCFNCYYIDKTLDHRRSLQFQLLGLGSLNCALPLDQSVYKIAILVPFDPRLEDIFAAPPADQPRAYKNVALLHVRVREESEVSAQARAASTAAFYAAKAILSEGMQFRVEGIITEHDNAADMKARMLQLSAYGRVPVSRQFRAPP
ncbi:unnamed protein product [Dibothriocephalus latus]|uniref:Uncharacterized protein n=1 Tax=Dibothriocephalus latus TaxID=60516 RepID=A0A3P7LKM2_DIBLA|nr:unnamed protein product [Dibothriocephalus latus]